MRWYFLLLLMLNSFLAGAQVPFFRALNVGDNDQLTAVNALAQDNNGYLLVGTASGLFTYNGRYFTQVPDSLHQPVTAIASNIAGTWIGYKNGDICILKNNSLLPFISGGGSGNATINEIRPLNDSTLLVATDTKGIIIYCNGKISYGLNTGNGLSDDYVYQVAFSPDKSLCIAGTDGGISLLANTGKTLTQQKSITTRSGIPDNIVRSVCYTPAKQLLIAGSQEGGICCISFKNPAHDSILFYKKDWQWGQVNDIIELTDNTYWIATDLGFLVELINTGVTFHLRPVYTCDKKLRKLVADKAGNIWCGTNEGLIMFSSIHVANMILSNNYALGKVTATTCDNNNVLIYAMGNDVYALDNDLQSRLLVQTKDVVTSLYSDANGVLWIGTLGQGVLSRDKNGKLHSLNDGAQLKSRHILSINGINDTLWVAGLNGVDEIKTNKDINACRHIRHHSKQTGIGSDYVYQIFCDSRKRVWMATDGAGICMFTNNSYNNFKNIPGLNSKVVYSVTEDSHGNIWLATLRDGLFRFDNKTWKQFDKRNGLTDINISAITATSDGRVIIVHQKGIDEYYAAYDAFRHYNKRLGMDIDSTSAIVNCYARDNNGNVYIPYEHGFIVFNSTSQLPRVRPDIHITSIELFSNPITQDRSRFGPAENSFAFKFDGINFTNPDKLYYRYKLAGYNNDWVVTNDESAIFPQLPPGSYSFRIQASLSPDFNLPAEARYNFTISTPVWKKMWFIVLLSLLALGIIVAYIKQREKKQQKMAKLEKERYQYEYEYLKSQVNPHFLFNSLNTLVNLIDEDAGQATDYTINLSDFYRSLLSSNNKDVILLKEEWELVEKYIYIQKSRFGDALDIQLKATPELMHTTKIVPMALQLLLENAIKHNIVSLTYPLHITIGVTDKALTIENNIQPKINKEKGAGLGLENLRRRYALHGNKTIEQYIDNNNFIVKLPLL